MGKPALTNVQTKVPSVNEYATADDFQELFACEMEDLFRLAFLLTADAEKAEHCLLLTMQECVASHFVVRWWLPVWTRNALIRNAIRIATGDPALPNRKWRQNQMVAMVRTSQPGAMDASGESGGFLVLSDFDRFVYVISSIEHYPIGDCAALLGRSRQEIRQAQVRAAGLVSASELSWDRVSHPVSPDPCLPPPEQGTQLRWLMRTSCRLRLR